MDKQTDEPHKVLSDLWWTQFVSYKCSTKRDFFVLYRKNVILIKQKLWFL